MCEGPESDAQLPLSPTTHQLAWVCGALQTHPSSRQPPQGRIQGPLSLVPALSVRIALLLHPPAQVVVEFRTRTH